MPAWKTKLYPIKVIALSYMPKQKFSPEQEQIMRAWIPKPPPNLSEQAQMLFEASVNKIIFTPHEADGVSVDYSKLTPEEAYALGIVGNDAFPLFIPKHIRLDMAGELPQGKIIPTSEQMRSQQRVRENGRKYVLQIAHAEKFVPKRKKGAISKKTEYIRNLVKLNPNLSAKELFDIADKEIIGDMKLETFQNRVSEAPK